LGYGAFAVVGATTRDATLVHDRQHHQATWRERALGLVPLFELA
jgi:hypothetical protein